MTWTQAASRMPAGFPYHKAVPRKLMVDPEYMGELVTLKGNPVTISSLRMPK